MAIGPITMQANLHPVSRLLVAEEETPSTIGPFSGSQRQGSSTKSHCQSTFQGHFQIWALEEHIYPVYNWGYYFDGFWGLSKSVNGVVSLQPST